MSRRWTPRTVAERAIEVWRTEGARSLALRVVGELGYRRMLLYERPFDLEVLPDLEPPLAVEFRRAGESDADAVGDFLPQSDAADVRQRLSRGEVCWVGELEGRVVHCCWCAVGRARIDYLDAQIVLPPGVAYLYDLHTEPGLRGRGVHLAMYLRMFRRLGELQPRTFCATFHPENRTYRIFERYGARHVATIGYVGIPGWRKLFYRPVSADPAGATPRARRSRSRPAGTPSSPGASTRRSRGRASSPAPRGS